MSYWTHLFFDHIKHEDVKAWKHFSIPAKASVPYIQDFLPVLPATTHPALKGKNPKRLNNFLFLLHEIN